MKKLFIIFFILITKYGFSQNVDTVVIEMIINNKKITDYENIIINVFCDDTMYFNIQNIDSIFILPKCINRTAEIQYKNYNFNTGKLEDIASKIFIKIKKLSLFEKRYIKKGFGFKSKYYISIKKSQISEHVLFY